MLNMLFYLIIGCRLSHVARFIAYLAVCLKTPGRLRAQHIHHQIWSYPIRDRDIINNVLSLICRMESAKQATDLGYVSVDANIKKWDVFTHPCNDDGIQLFIVWSAPSSRITYVSEYVNQSPDIFSGSCHLLHLLLIFSTGIWTW